MPCLNCGEPGAQILDLQDDAHHVAVFCSIRCAAQFAHELVYRESYKVCTMCRKWTDIDGSCAECDVRITIASAEQLFGDDPAGPYVEGR